MKKHKVFLLASLFFLLSYNPLVAQCIIEDVTATAHSCDGDSFSVDIYFNTVAVSDSVTIVGNGNNYGTFAYTNLPITLGPFLADNSTIYEFIVSDYQNFCSDFGFVGPIDCNTDCQLTNIFVEAQPCDANGNFMAELQFAYQNMPSDSFHLTGNGINYGTFPYTGSNGVTILTFGPIIGDASTIYEFIVTDSESSICNLDFEFLETIDCGGSDCEIWDLEVWDFECNNDGTYQLNLNFNYANVNNDFFDVFANGEFIGFYAFADLPLTIEDFPLSGNDNDVIKICQNDLPTCCETLEFEAPECGNSDCFGFEDLVLNSVYASPDYQDDDLIFTTGSMPVKFQEFYLQSNLHLASVTIADNNLPIYQYPNFDDNFIKIDSSTLEFNFLQLGEAVVHAEFDYYDPGLWINLSANDAPITGTNSFPLLDGQQIAPGVLVSVTTHPTIVGSGKVSIDGFIGLLKIGGMNGLAIDNLCLEYAAIGDCWAGDTNSDYIANNFDLLNIGLAYGAEGTPRDDASIAWVAQASDDWAETFEDGTNYKHADANGDGIVNAQDKFAIDENFGLTHGNIDPYVSPIPSSDDPAFFIVMPDPNDIGIGAFEAEIHLGTTANAIDALYGLAFTIEFNDQIFDATSMEIAFENGWLNNNGTDDLLSVQKEENGKLAAAVSRINHANINGGGKIGTISGIIDDLSGYAEIELGIINIKGITTSETLVPFNTPENYVKIGTGIFENKLNRNLSVFPNPASDLIFIKNENDSPIENIRLMNILGQEVLQKSVNEYGLVELNVANILEGIYFLEIQMDGFKVSRKIEITQL